MDESRRAASWITQLALAAGAGVDHQLALAAGAALPRRARPPTATPLPEARGDAGDAG